MLQHPVAAGKYALEKPESCHTAANSAPRRAPGTAIDWQWSGGYGAHQLLPPAALSPPPAPGFSCRHLLSRGVLTPEGFEDRLVCSVTAAQRSLLPPHPLPHPGCNPQVLCTKNNRHRGTRLPMGMSWSLSAVSCLFEFQSCTCL